MQIIRHVLWWLLIKIRTNTYCYEHCPMIVNLKQSHLAHLVWTVICFYLFECHLEFIQIQPHDYKIMWLTLGTKTNAHVLLTLLIWWLLLLQIWVLHDIYKFMTRHHEADLPNLEFGLCLWLLSPILFIFQYHIITVITEKLL